MGATADAEDDGRRSDPKGADEPDETPLIVVEPWEGYDRCLPPRADGPPWEQILHRANRAAAADARARVRMRLPEIDDLLAAEWGSPPRPLSGDGGLAGLLDGLLDELVRHHHLPPGRLAVTPAEDEAASLDVADLGYGIIRPDPLGIARLLAAGGGLAILGVEEHRPSLGQWVEDLDRVVGQLCRIDLVVAGGVTGSTANPGPAANLVVVLSGTGHLDAYGEPGVGPSPSTAPTSMRLESGSICFLPPGWGSRLVGDEDTLVAARVVLPRLIALELAGAIGSEAVHWPLLRADVPNDPAALAPSYAGTVFDHPADLADALLTLADDEAPGRALARHRGATGARRTGSLTAALAAIGGDGTQAVTVRAPLPGGMQVGPDQDDGSVVWFAAGRKLRLSPETATALAPLADGRRVALEDLEAPGRQALGAALGAGLLVAEVHQ